MISVRKLIFVSFFISFLCLNSYTQEPFIFPNTPAGSIFEEFIDSFNSSSLDTISKFVEKNYSSPSQREIQYATEEWMDLYSRFGKIKAHSISINDPYDLEIWVQGEVTKTWFAIEFILNEKTKKIRATGLLMGEQPQGVESFSKNDKEFIDKLTTYLNENEESNFFQGTILVQKGEDLLLKKAYGYANTDSKIKNEVDTRMRISSITKIFTSIAILKLVSERKLDLFKPISAYLPELPRHISDKISIFQLLVHTSNYELDGIEGFRDAEQRITSLEDLYRLHLSYLPKWNKYENFQTSNRYDYSNDSYNLLAIIVEKVSGADFSSYLDENIFRPCGMTNTSFNRENLAIPYRYDLSANKLLDYESYYGQTISGAGVLNSTVDDLLKLHRSLFLSNPLLDFGFNSGMLTPLVYKGGGDYHSLGMTISYPLVFNVGHNGTNIGNSAEYRYFPESGYVLIVLCNNRSGAQNVYNYFKNNIPKH